MNCGDHQASRHRFQRGLCNGDGCREAARAYMEQWRRSRGVRPMRRRSLTDAEARYEAALIIEAAVKNAVAAGVVPGEAERRGWTELDALAVEQFVIQRVESLTTHGNRKVDA